MESKENIKSQEHHTVSFDDMMVRAKTSDLERDTIRSLNADESKRYEALAFPAFDGSPIRTNSFFVAWLVSIYRSFEYAEARIIDHKTGRHYVI